MREHIETVWTYDERRNNDEIVNKIRVSRGKSEDWGCRMEVDGGYTRKIRGHVEQTKIKLRV